MQKKLRLFKYPFNDQRQQMHPQVFHWVFMWWLGAHGLLRVGLLENGTLRNTKLTSVLFTLSPLPYSNSQQRGFSFNGPPITHKSAFCKLVCGMCGLPKDKRLLSVPWNQVWNSEEKLALGALHGRRHALPGWFYADGKICSSLRASGPPCQDCNGIKASPSLSAFNSCPSFPPVN